MKDKDFSRTLREDVNSIMNGNGYLLIVEDSCSQQWINPATGSVLLFNYKSSAAYPNDTRKGTVIDVFSHVRAEQTSFAV